MKALILLAVLLLGAGPAGTPGPGAPAAVIHIHDFGYDPDSVTVAPGSTVEWDNDDSARHTVTADGFDSGDIRPGQKWTHVFPTAGTFAYSCTQHPDMTATVYVK